MTDLIDRFIKVFCGRGDVHGSWTGGCVKEPLTRRHYEQHLGTGPHIGVYPLIGSRCTWGCIDIDGKQHATDVAAHKWDWDAMFDIASNLVKALDYKGIVAHTERTDNGIHVWVFPDRPLVPAKTMRRALMAACKVVRYDPREVNPKQEKLKGGQVGNYVRLPYPGGSVSLPTARVFYSDRESAELTIFELLERVEATRTPLSTLEEVAALWTPPTAISEVNTDAGMHAEHLLGVIGGLAKRIWRDGPLDGSDRSNTLAKLAYLLAEDGLTPDAAFTIVRSADERWGKFHSRPDCDEQLSRLIERAYAK